MCRLLTPHDHNRFLKVSRSVRIAGHSTSIRLESAFWNTLDDMATAEGLSRAQLIGQLHHEAMEHGGMPSLASMLRTVCLLYQQEKRMTVAMAGRRT